MRYCSRNQCGSVLAIAVTLMFASLADAQDWPRFRGPQGNGVAESSVPETWSPDENLKWKAELPGAGVSCPIIIGEKVFVTCYSGYGESRNDIGKKEDLKRHICCFNRKTGDKLWERTVDGTDSEDDFSGIGVTAHGYASHTPVSDGKRLFAFLGKSGVVAYDLDGKELWRHGVGEDSDSKRWGSASSPIVFENLVIVPAVAESDAIYGLNKETGEEVWKFPAAAMDNSWATPAIVKVSDDRSDIVMGVPNELWGINPKNGKLTWAASGVGGDSFYTSAVEKDGIIYAAVGGRTGGGSIAVRAGGKKDVTESHLEWKGGTMGSFASPVIYNDLMFVIGRGGVIQVVDTKTGERVNQLRLQAPEGSPAPRGRFGSADYGSPVIAGGKLYYTKGSGETYVCSADKECKQLAVNTLTKDSEIFSGSPAVSGGDLFIRSNKHLYCVGE